MTLLCIRMCMHACVHGHIRLGKQMCCLCLFLCLIILDVAQAELLGGDSAVSLTRNGHNHTSSKADVEMSTP